MNDDPPVITPAPVPSKPVSRLPTVFGFLTGTVLWLLSCLPPNNSRGIIFLIFACFGLPVIALILAIIPASRRFGLGLLLASGLGWLILVAICGGLFRMH